MVVVHIGNDEIELECSQVEPPTQSGDPYKVALTDHAVDRLMEYGLKEDAFDLISAVCRAVPVAPSWTEDRKAAALDCSLSVDPVVKFLRRTAVVTTLLPHGVPLKAGTEVVYVP